MTILSSLVFVLRDNITNLILCESRFFVTVLINFYNTSDIYLKSLSLKLLSNTVFTVLQLLPVKSSKTNSCLRPLLEVFSSLSCTAIHVHVHKGNINISLI